MKKNKMSENEGTNTNSADKNQMNTLKYLLNGKVLTKILVQETIRRRNLLDRYLLKEKYI